jgi:hypothetical protein
MDAAAEVALLALLSGPGAAPRNDFMRRELEERVREVGDAPRARGEAALLPQPVRSAIDVAGRGALRAELHALAALDEGAFRFASDAVRIELVERGASWLERRRAFLAACEPLEAALRASLGLPEVPGALPHPAVLPHPRTQRWLEAALGHSIALGPPPRPALTLRSHRRSVVVFEG